MTACSSETDRFSARAEEFFLAHRLTIALFMVTFINIFLEHAQKRIVTRFASYKYMKPETCQEMGMRMLQLFFGSIVVVAGIGFLSYFASSRCNLFNLYVFYIAGNALVCTDLHEHIARWPLRPALLGHHLMSFVIGLAFLEFKELPANEAKKSDWATALFLTNIGMMWVVDFFHVVYRTSTNLPLIKKTRKIYLCASAIRIINILLLALGSINSAIFGSWLGFGCLTFMCSAYTYNSYAAITFVARFDCDAYYSSHQAQWFAESDELLKGWLGMAFLPKDENTELQTVDLNKNDSASC